MPAGTRNPRNPVLMQLESRRETKETLTQSDQVVSCATLMLSFEMECSWSSTQFLQDRVAAKLEELRQAHKIEEVAASADLEPQLDVVVLHFSRLLKLLRADGIK